MEMDNEKEVLKTPFPMVLDTMPGRELRTTSIDRKLYESTTGFHGIYPYSKVICDNERDFPY